MFKCKKRIKMEELREQIKERIKELQLNPCLVNIGKVSELTLVNMKLKQLILSDVGNSSSFNKGIVEDDLI